MGSVLDGGEGGIRTPETFRFTRFPSERTRPLCDLSRPVRVAHCSRTARKNATCRAYAVAGLALLPASSASTEYCPAPCINIDRLAASRMRSSSAPAPLPGSAMSPSPIYTLMMATMPTAAKKSDAMRT